MVPVCTLLWALVGGTPNAKADTPAASQSLVASATRHNQPSASLLAAHAHTSPTPSLGEADHHDKRVQEAQVKEVVVTATISGFRMEPPARIESVFGDIPAFKRQIDAFGNLEVGMSVQRRHFAQAAHRLQAALGEPTNHNATRRGKRRLGSCPTRAIAQSFAAALVAQHSFRTLGRDLERSYLALHQLRLLGEGEGLTPDYRARIAKSRSIYEEALRDLGEMNSVMAHQIDSELSQRGCDRQALLLAAKTMQKSAVPAPSPAPAASAHPAFDKARKNSHGPRPPILARSATFSIDNRTCAKALDVYVDSVLLGQVGAGKQAAFQSLSGQHALCLVEENHVASCGDTGTVRTAFLHDGFQIRRSCSSPNAIAATPRPRPPRSPAPSEH